MGDYSLKDRLDSTAGRPSGFDYMRLGLAVAIICFHSVTVTYGQGAQNKLLSSEWAVPFQFVVPMFFALSGFLVAGSYERCKTLISFLGLRVLRIGPALAVEVTLSALLLGVVFTNLPLAAYFSDPAFGSYFLNVIGDIHYHLPGVFEHNPTSPVNGQLWTVPFELECYILLAALAILGIVRRRGVLLAATAGVQAALAIHALRRPDIWVPGLSGEMLILCFTTGLLFFRYRTHIPWNWGLATACGILSALMLITPNGKYFVVAPISYFTVYLGLLNPVRNRIILSGDYSYGLYLFGYPIQQALIATFGPSNWEINLLLSLPCSIAFAWISWHLVEKHALRLKPRLIALETLLVSFAKPVSGFEPARDTINQETPVPGSSLIDGRH